jgi:Putative DNA-binding domain
MLDLKNKADLQRLVDEALEESLTLDYKASPALTRDGKGPDELCKDVSALANSAGGQLVYGIEEDKFTKKPSRVDDGVADPKVTREWIEQILNSRVQPRMSGVTTTRIDMENGKFGYMISVSPTQTGPHQAPHQKYYRRFDLQSVPMHDYEIKDVVRRSTTPSLYVKFAFTNGERTTLEFPPTRDSSDEVRLLGTLGNNSSQPAFHAFIRVGISTGIPIIQKSLPWTSSGTEETKDFGKIAWIYQRVSSPPALPIFKELEQPLDQVGISIRFHERTLAQSHRWPIVVQIHSPGFSSTEAWFIQQQGSGLRLLAPGHPLVR